MKKLIYFLLAFTLIAGFSCKKNKKKEQEQLPPVDTVSMEQPTFPFEEPLANPDSNQVITDTDQSDQVLTVDSTNNEITPIQDNQVNTNEGSIYIIVGSFRVYQNAMKAKQYYENLGYNPQILPQVAGYNRVAIKAFNNLEQARSELKKLRNQFNRPDFWLLYKK